jgi:hypothetical protein
MSIERDGNGKPVRPEGVPVKVCVGFPAAQYLHEFGSQVWHAFGDPPYLVGSALFTTEWRDVDVRTILTDEEWERLDLGDPERPSGKAMAFNLAFSELGRRMTGLPIDFQLQQQTHANQRHKGARSAIGLVHLRYEQAADAMRKAKREGRAEASETPA